MSVFGEFYDPCKVYEDLMSTAERTDVLSHILEGDPVPRAQIEPLVLKGVPEHLRPQLWKCYSRYGFNQQVTYNENLIQTATRENIDMISRDTTRTFISVIDDVAIEMLSRVLRAYSAADPEVGYTQGMNFVASLPVLYMSESDAFNTLYCLMNNPAIYLRNIYETGFAGFFELGDIWLKLLEKRHKWFWKKVKAGASTDPIMIISRCFQSVLMAFNVPMFLKFTMFDRIVVAGKRALLSFGLAVVRIFARELQQLNADDMQVFLMQMDQKDIFNDCNFVIACWNKEWVTEDEYKSLF